MTLDLDALERENDMATNWEGQISCENVEALIKELREARAAIAEADRRIAFMQWAECGCLGSGYPPDDWVLPV